MAARLKELKKFGKISATIQKGLITSTESKDLLLEHPKLSLLKSFYLFPNHKSDSDFVWESFEVMARIEPLLFPDSSHGCLH